MASAGYLPPLSDRCSYPCSVPSQRTSQGDPKETNEFKTKEEKATQNKKRGQVSKKGNAKRQALGARN